MSSSPWYVTYTKDNEVVYCDDEDFIVFKDIDGKYIAVGNYYGGFGAYDTLEEARHKKWEYYRWSAAMDAN